MQIMITQKIFAKKPIKTSTEWNGKYQLIPAEHGRTEWMLRDIKQIMKPRRMTMNGTTRWVKVMSTQSMVERKKFIGKSERYHPATGDALQMQHFVEQKKVAKE